MTDTILSADSIDQSALQDAIDAFDVNHIQIDSSLVPKGRIVNLHGVDVLPSLIVKTSEGYLALAEVYLDLVSGSHVLTETAEADVLFSKQDGNLTVLQIKTRDSNSLDTITRPD